MLFNLRVVVLCAIYVVSGAFIALTSQWQKYQGMNVQSGILIVGTYIAEIMSFGATFTERVEPRFCKPRPGQVGSAVQVVVKETRKAATFHPVMVVIALVDVVALAVTSLGTQTGVLLWTSGYSLITLLTAIWRKVFLKRPYDPLQWVGVITILVGVVAETVWSLLDDIANQRNTSSLAFGTNHTTNGATPAPLAANNLLALGLGVVSACCYSTDYVLLEWIQMKSTNSQFAPPKPLTILSFTGIIGFILAVFYILLYTIPNWEEVVAGPVNQTGGNVVAIAWMWLAGAAGVFLHFWSFYSICQTSSLHAGVSKAVESCLIFLFADLLYCNPWPALNIPGSQLNCLNGAKGTAMATYIIGISVYSVGQIRLARKMNIKGHEELPDASAGFAPGTLSSSLLEDVARESD